MERDPAGEVRRDHPLLERHRLVGIVALVILLGALSLLVVMAFDSGMEQAQKVDDSVREAFLAIRWEPLTWLATAFGVVGTWYVTWPLRVAITWYLALRKRREALWTWVLAFLIYEPAVGILKAVYERPRPPEPLVGVTNFSYPSGHATVGAALAIGLVFVLVPAGPRRRNLEILAGVFAFFMALSRVYLDVHWFTDVVAGSALGASVMIGVPALIHEWGDWLHRRRIRSDLRNGGHST